MPYKFLVSPIRRISNIVHISTKSNKNIIINTPKRSFVFFQWLYNNKDSSNKVNIDVSYKINMMSFEELIIKHNFVVEDTPVKSESDSKEYIAIKLSNGLRVLLISDVNNIIPFDAQSSNNSPVESSDEDSNSDTDSSSSSSSKNSINDEPVGRKQDDECGKRGDKKDDDELVEKLAACALTVGAGSFSDPEHIPGLAHFLEHMLFMGNEKYPKENDFDSFISTRGGSDNAETECEYTSFYFDCPEIHLKGALDRFSQFFITPTMDRSSIRREKEAVESEFKSNSSSDSVRCEQLLCSTAHSENPAHKFMWGNLITLQDNVNDDILYTALRTFWERHYSAHRMTVVIQARLPINILVNFAATYFGNIRSNNLPADSFTDIETPFNMELFHKFYTVEPVKDTNKLEITWVVPTVQGRYKTKPLSYISHLLGHEGDGSLMAFLQDKLWALNIYTGIESDGIDNNSIFSLFSIHILLTENGITNIDKVIYFVFSYIKLLQTSGPVESIFRELQSLDEINFRFKEEEDDPTIYVEEISQTMQIYPAANYLNGNELLFDYDPDEIQRYLNMLTVDKVNILLLSKIAAEQVELDKTEKWFSTKYNEKDIPDEWLSQWSDCEVHPNLHLPKPNVYISTDFRILQCPERETEVPKLIVNTDYIETWHKQDTKYKLPIVVVKVCLIPRNVLLLPENCVMTDIFVSLFLLMTAKNSYPAKLAGIDYAFHITDGGFLELSLYGYNDKFNLLFDLLLKELMTFITNVDEGMFEAVKQEAKKIYYNRLLKLSKLSSELRLSVLCEPYWSSNLRLKALPIVTLEALRTFSAQMLGSLYVKCLVQGNITENQAKEISNKVLEVINFTPILQSCFPRYLVRKLPEGGKVIRVQSFNTKDENCSVTNYYQCGVNSIEAYCKIDLLMMIIQEPLFDTLRTQEQLGYDVNCETRVTNGILGFTVTVKSQANKHTVDYVEERITRFLESMQKYIKEIPLSEYNQIKESLMILKQQADNDLRSEVKRYWSEIETNEYQFDRPKKELECIESLKRGDLVKHFKDILTENKTKSNKCLCKKLSVQIDGTLEQEDTVDCQEKKMEKSTELRFKIPNDGQLTYINNLEEFKSGLYMYPLQHRFKKQS